MFIHIQHLYTHKTDFLINVAQSSNYVFPTDYMYFLNINADDIWLIYYAKMLHQAMPIWSEWHRVRHQVTAAAVPGRSRSKSGPVLVALGWPDWSAASSSATCHILRKHIPDYENRFAGTFAAVTVSEVASYAVLIL